MAPGSDGRDTEVLWRQLFDLVTCASCWQAPQYHAPSDEPSQPPVQTLAESLIPSSVLGLSANASLDEEATLLSSQQQSGMAWPLNTERCTLGFRPGLAMHNRISPSQATVSRAPSIPKRHSYTRIYDCRGRVSWHSRSDCLRHTQGYLGYHHGRRQLAR